MYSLVQCSFKQLVATKNFQMEPKRKSSIYTEQKLTLVHCVYLQGILIRLNTIISILILI